jgi:hypothetical protein
MLKKSIKYLFYTIGMVVVLPAQAQYFEMGLWGGVAKYRGDLTPKNGDAELNPAFGGALVYHFNPRFSFRTQLLITRLTGDDLNSTDEARRRRNLRFSAPVTEFSFLGGFNILPFVPGKKGSAFSPFITAGLAFMHFKPTTTLNGNTYNLYYYSTEGQGLYAYPGTRRYQLIQIVFPLSAGIKYALSKKINVGMEFQYRLTTTDYLDDVSNKYPDPQNLYNIFGELGPNLSDRTPEYLGYPAPAQTGQARGNPNDKDSYFTLSLFFTYNFYDTFPFSEKKKVNNRDEPEQWF